MNSLNSCKLIQDSKGNKFCFFYSAGSIYCKTRDQKNFIKETVLIDKAHSNFLCTISKNDIIYVLCQLQDQNMVLFVNENDRWNFDEIPLAKNVSNPRALFLFNTNDGINIIYCSKLPIAHYYNVYHVVKYKGKWKEKNICELYSKQVNPNITLFPSENDFINMVCTFFDGKQISLNHYEYNPINDEWEKHKIVTLENLDIKVKLLNYKATLYLICCAQEDENITTFIFKKAFDSSFALIDIIRFYPFKGKNLLIHDINDKILAISFCEKDRYFTYHYNFQYKKWIMASEIPLFDNPSLYHIEYTINKNLLKVITKEVVCCLNKDLYLFPPKLNSSPTEIKKNSPPTKIDDEPNLALMEEIKTLTNRISVLNDKLNDLGKTNYRNNITLRQKEVKKHNIPKQRNSNTFKRSDFRERFMKSSPQTIGINSDFSLSQNQMKAYTEYPNDRSIINTQSKPMEINKPKEDEKQQSSLFKKISEFFK